MKQVFAKRFYMLSKKYLQIPVDSEAKGEFEYVCRFISESC